MQKQIEKFATAQNQGDIGEGVIFFKMILKIINFLILIICLLIVSQIIDSVKNLKKRDKKSISSLFFLHSDTFLRGIKLLFFGIVIWAIKDGLILVKEITGVTINIEDFLGILSAIVLSYGLFLIIFPLKKIFKI